MFKRTPLIQIFTELKILEFRHRVIRSQWHDTHVIFVIAFPVILYIASQRQAHHDTGLDQLFSSPSSNKKIVY